MHRLGYATEMANRLVALLEPCCERIAVAGSIRRKRPQVKDIDLVIITGSLSGLGITLLRYGEILTKRRLDSTTRIIKYRFRGVLVEIYMANPQTWPMLLLVRTGSVSHNQMLAMRARSRGLKFKANGDGILDADGRRISADTEESIFEALGMKYVPPEEREI